MKKIIFVCLMLICSFSVHADSLAERWALTVPSVTENNMSQLVHYLTKGINSKYEQAKAIAVWIAAHVAYDNYSYSAMTGGKVSNRLQKGEQSAEEVFKTRIGTCEGYANLYSKMLGMAGIQNEQIRGFALDGLRNNVDARKQVKRKKIGHVWNKVIIPGRKAVLVDITWMSRGQTAQTDKRLTQHLKNRELRKIKRERPTYSYNMTYFDFTYKDRQKHGEYRFSLDRQILK